MIKGRKICEYIKIFFKEQAADWKFSVTKNGTTDRFSDELKVLSKSVEIGKKTVKNSLGIHPMEGCDANPDGSCSDLALRRYERFAKGGAGLIWFEATAVNPKGKDNPRHLNITEENLEKFKEVRNIIEKESEGCNNKCSLRNQVDSPIPEERWRLF